MVRHPFQPVQAAPSADIHALPIPRITNLLSNEEITPTPVLCGSYRVCSPLVPGRHVFLSSGADGV